MRKLVLHFLTRHLVRGKYTKSRIENVFFFFLIIVKVFCFGNMEISCFDMVEMFCFSEKIKKAS